MKNNIYRRGSTWWVRFSVDNQRINNSLHTKVFEEAKLLAPKAIAKYRTGSKIDGEMGWEAFKARYLDWKRAHHSIEGTVYKDELAFRYYEEKLKPVLLKDITPLKIEEFQTHLKLQEKTNTNTNRLVRSMKTALRKAEDWELIDKQNWRKVKLLKEPKGKLLFFSIEEVEKLIAKSNGIWKTVTYLGARAGLRRGEMLSLRWQDIDFSHRLIRIQAHDHWNPKDWEARGIPMTDDLFDYLKKVQNGSEYVLGDDRPSLDVLTNYYKRIIKRAGLRGSVHVLRHTFGSHLALSGANNKHIKDLMGHASVETSDIYMHLSPENLKLAISRLPPLK